jgi:hypothetical protein
MGLKFTRLEHLICNEEAGGSSPPRSTYKGPVRANDEVVGSTPTGSTDLMIKGEPRFDRGCPLAVK